MNATEIQKGSLWLTKVNGQVVTAKFIEPYRDSMVMEHEGRRFLRVPSVIERLNPNGPVSGATTAQVQVTAAAATATTMTVPALSGRPTFDVNLRFNFIQRLVDMIVRGQETSLLVTGSGGVGKSHTVYDRIKMMELGEADYCKVSGHVTPKALYRRLYETNGMISVFDDCDSILDNETAVNILKAALDSTPVRTVHWNTEHESEDLPNSFEFTGRVIFISNKTLKDVPQPLISRAMYVDVTMTPEEKVSRIRAIARDLVPDLNDNERHECIELIDTLKHLIADLNFRTMRKVASIRKANPNHWRDMASYMVTAAPASGR